MRLTGIGRSLAARLGSRTFASLARHPNYRLYWFGALASNIGTWMQMVAQGWLVYDLTGSELFLGIVGFASAIPTLFLSLFGGALADRFERRRLMLGTQTGSMVLAFALAALTLSGHVTVWQIAVVAFLNGVVNSLNAPVRQSIVSDLVSREDLTNAIAVNSAQFQISRMIGPAIAGIVVALVGPGWCFAVNGVSFVAVIVALLAMKVPPLVVKSRRASVWENIVEGIAYVRDDRVILALLGLAAIPAMFAMPYQSLMPAFAISVLDVGARGQGMLMSAAGLGAVIGALGIASLGKGVRRGRLMLICVIGFGLSLAAFATSTTFGLSLALLVLVGIASMSYGALNQSFLQSLADDQMRGRVMSLLTLVTFGLQPFGQLGVGALAEVVGPSVTLVIGGLICAGFAGLVFVLRPTIRQLR